jgi:signal transduction histidine kinase
MRHLLLFTCLVSAFLFAVPRPLRAAPADSLRRRLATAPIDTNRVRLLAQLAQALSYEEGEQALRYGQAGLRLARQLRYPYGEALLLVAIGTTYFRQQNDLQAARYFQQALRRTDHLPHAEPLQEKAVLGLGRLAVQESDYAEGERYFRQAIQLTRLPQYRPTPEEISILHNSLGMLYLTWLRSGHAAPDSAGRLCLYHNRMALATLTPQSAPQYFANGLNSLALVHRFKQRYDSAIYYQRRALQAYERMAEPYQIANTRVLLGETLIMTERYLEALEELRPALATARRQHQLPLVARASLIMSLALRRTGQSATAFDLAKAGYELKDSLQKAQRIEELAHLRVQFDTEQERSHVRELTQRSQLQQLQAARQHQYLWWLGTLLGVVAASAGGLLLLALRLRRQQQQLVRQHTDLGVARAEQDRLYALIAHDLRSPVVAFGGLADLLTTYVARQDTARLAGLGDRIRQAAESLRGLLENLLHWALAQRGELRPTLEPVPIQALLSEVGQLYQATAEAADVQLAVAPSADCVVADRNMTLTILRNLVSNALQATPAGGRITVRAIAASTSQVLLEVADTGAGMDDEELRRVTNGQDWQTAARYRGRAGLGLRLSFLFAHSQAGQLKLTSAPGEGTTATLSLQRAAP